MCSKRDWLAYLIILQRAVFGTAEIVYGVNNNHARTERKYLWITSKNETDPCKMFSLNRDEQSLPTSVDVSPDEFEQLLTNCYEFTKEYGERSNSNRKFLRKLLIFPGTKWCGLGSIAQHFNDLGPDYPVVDACCREHDYCAVSIPPNTCVCTYYNSLTACNHQMAELCNTSSISMSHCECEDRFKRCLTQSNSMSGSMIYLAYFRVLGMKCFQRCLETGRLHVRQSESN